MNIIIDSKKLLKGLEIVKPVVTTNKFMPICENIKVKSDKDCIALIASNVHHSIITQVPCEVKGGINVLIPFMDLYNICKGLPDQLLTIEIGEQIKITSSNGEYLITSPDEVSDFPKVEVIQPEAEIEIPSSQINQIKPRSVKFIHPDEIYADKHGVCFDFEKDVLNVVATNSECLSLLKIPCQGVRRKYFLDKDTIELLNIFSFTGGVSFKFNDKKFQAQNDDTILISSVRDENFPEYKHLITNTNCLIEVNRQELLNSLLRSSKFSANEDLINEFTVSEQLTINSKNINYGRSFNEILGIIDQYGFSDGFKVAFNVKLLIDYLSICTTETIKISGSEKGTLFYIQEPESDNIFLLCKRMI